MTALRLVFPGNAKRVRRPRPTKRGVSILQMRQRELAWILYCTEGYAANLHKALAVNAIAFEQEDNNAVQAMITEAEGNADYLRRQLLQLQD